MHILYLVPGIIRFSILIIKNRYQPCEEKYQKLQICRWHYPNARKRRGTKSLNEGERGEWKIWLKNSILKNKQTNKLRLWHLVSSVQFSHLDVSDSLQPHGLPTAHRPPCLSLTPRVYSDSFPLSWWCHPTISSSVVPFSSHLQSFPASGSFQESALRIRWPKYWSFSFSISPSNEHPGLISFRMDWLGLLAVQETLKSLLQHHSSKASILQCSAFFIDQLSHPYMNIGKIIALTR